VAARSEDVDAVLVGVGIAVETVPQIEIAEEPPQVAGQGLADVKAWVSVSLDDQRDDPAAEKVERAGTACGTRTQDNDRGMQNVVPREKVERPPTRPARCLLSLDYTARWDL
jgi:hypothetical protein